MSNDVTTTNLQINILSKDQYREIDSINDSELYFVEDERVVFLVSVSETEPLTANEGDKYYSTTTKLIYTYTDNSWSTAGLQPEPDMQYVSKDTMYTYVLDEDKLVAIGGFGGCDEKTIVKNSDGKIQAIGNINKNDNSVKYDWVGSYDEYNSLGTYNDNWVYFITDGDNVSDNMSLSNVLNRLNRAYAWRNITSGVETLVYTIPLPERGYTIYSDTKMTEVGKVHDCDETYISDGYKRYERYEDVDSIFDGVSEDSKLQILTMYDLIKAFRG